MNEESRIINHNVSSESDYVEEFELVSRKEITNKFQLALIVASGVVAAISSLIFHYYFKIF